jgi:hypothetical protein
VNSATELHCSLFLTWTVHPLCTVHVNCTVHWTLQLTPQCKKSMLHLLLPILRCKHRKWWAPWTVINGFFFTKRLAPAFWLKRNLYRVNKRPLNKSKQYRQSRLILFLPKLSLCAFFFLWVSCFKNTGYYFNQTCIFCGFFRTQPLSYKQIHSCTKL